ncbi:hypothetical protein GCM10008171_13540 [Methylopila jiangsuensis]|uniref:DUF2065 domain-containing protein n=1 Tax=Methylopila jiangsuensis TaxID=586230 RepID=A0A9W6JHU4_9HYPH|nr:DUF2065 domain-containing protein [Methylopila jiangsuensis]MDR6286337.1 hypothetical protein [Methylopila jiangsuensis]GLK76100.1 hypothetical protein GCM10008171_13540 [Methylopila jiangsuensis]
MTDFFVALGLVLVIEGVLFAAVPGAAKRSCANILATPDVLLRGVGLGAAVLGLGVIWLVRG